MNLGFVIHFLLWALVLEAQNWAHRGFLWLTQSILQLRGVPVLFIPGNAGSYKQVRPIAAEAANHFHHHLQYDRAKVDAGVRSLDFFTVDFNEDITAFHGQTLLDQAEYLNEAVRYILSLYSDPQRAMRDSYLPDPTSVIILGHSMGGVVARTMLVQPNYQQNSINTIITMSAPHARPPVTFDGQIVQIYDEINEYWREAYSQRWANNNPLWHVTLVSIAGGNLDTIVPSDYASVESFIPETHGFTVFSTGIPTVWTSMDHQAILWCDQFRKVITRTLYDIIDVHRGSQTKPRADRMRVFKKSLLSGLERTSEKSSVAEGGTTLLTVDDDFPGIVHAGQRLVLPASGSQPKSKIHLLALPPRGEPHSQRFSLLTDSHIIQAGESNPLDILLCRVLGHGSTSLSASLELSTGAASASRLACKSIASDAVLLPPSTASSRVPFSMDRDTGSPLSFTYLEYDMDHLADHHYIAVVDKSGSLGGSRFLLAEFSDISDYRMEEDMGLGLLLTRGLSITLPEDRPMVTELQVASITSSLLAYKLHIEGAKCGSPALFAPLVRQYNGHPFESRYFVNARDVGVSLHGVAPYLPPPLHPRPNEGITFQFWTDPTCNTPLRIALEVDIFGSLGKLYMRYRTVFAAFPLLTITLVLRKQFCVYDKTGVFVSFPESLDMSLRRSIPLLLLSLTLLSMPIGNALSMFTCPFWLPKTSGRGSHMDLHRNDLLTGTDDPFFWFLVPIIGIICTGVCAMVHYATLVLTHGLGLVYGLLSSMAWAITSDARPARSPTFIPSTPRRRMITTAALLFLVSIFIPYQFAYLVACLVQLFTAVKALKVRNSTDSEANLNYYHYAHSVFLLMLWVLPINLPILAVWIRNLAVHWLTPFSSHHNVLSIMPFILLVENLTAGRMIPQLKSGLRHITSILLFGTALCAALYGVSHAYILHFSVNIIAAWLVVVHLTTSSWSFTGIGAMFDGSANISTNDPSKRGKTP
jgi:GPI inositol-deacylase